METKEIFETLLANLKVGDKAQKITSRRDSITKSLNREFRELEKSSDYKLMVGSFGRHTAIRGISDLDMLFFLPESLRDDYTKSDTGPKRSLERVKKALEKTYPDTAIRVNQCVVTVKFSSEKFQFEIQPVFCNLDGSFTYPDTHSNDWKRTKPRDEIQATRECNQRTSNNMRRLARMTRAWRNNVGVAMGGLLIDTLVYRFFEQTDLFDSAGYDKFDEMVRDYFGFLKDQPNQDRFNALGSNQHVKVKQKFQKAAQNAYEAAVAAIEEENSDKALKNWRKIFGASIPKETKEAGRAFTDTEEFIEHKYPINICHSLKIDCQVTGNGFRPTFLSKILRSQSLIVPKQKLLFSIQETTAQQPYEVFWKVLNRGEKARDRDCIRGQIIPPNAASNARKESAAFGGNHVVECYIVKENNVVARDWIQTPIEG